MLPCFSNDPTGVTAVHLVERRDCKAAGGFAAFGPAQSCLLTRYTYFRRRYGATTPVEAS